MFLSLYFRFFTLRILVNSISQLVYQKYRQYVIMRANLSQKFLFFMHFFDHLVAHNN
jgi:hypothetical protein